MCVFYALAVSFIDKCWLCCLATLHAFSFYCIKVSTNVREGGILASVSIGSVA
jgi:hypothetical protein